MSESIEIFNLMKEHNQEQIAFYTDTTVKLRAILAIHSTALGPALGGIRISKYESVQEAVFELIRLSEIMTYKNAAAGLNFGGGHILVVEQEGMVRSEPLFRSLGRFVDSFKGRFIAAEDIGVFEDSMEYIGMETRYITGLPHYGGGSASHSDWGTRSTFLGIKAAAMFRWGKKSIKDKKIIIQGYGRIGTRLAKACKDEKANILIADINPERVKQARTDGFETIDADKVYEEKCDIFSPCAVGAVINPETAAKFRCEIIAGSANNQLLNPEDELLLKKRNILYAPDFIVSPGGIMAVAEEYLGYNEKRMGRNVGQIYGRLLEILKDAETRNIMAHQAAIDYARRRIEKVTKIRGNQASKEKTWEELNIRNKPGR